MTPPVPSFLLSFGISCCQCLLRLTLLRELLYPSQTAHIENRANMADPEPKSSSPESKTTSAPEEFNISFINKTDDNALELGAGEADAGNENLAIVGVSDDEDGSAVQTKEIGHVEANGHSAQQSIITSVETDGNVKPIPPGKENHNQADSEIGNNSVGTGIGSAPKKKKKKPSKSKSKRGLAAPTGFEEYYVDAPVTPAEFEEEKGLYHESRPFTERIEIAIQRFVARRNFDAVRKDLFDKYLAYGGVESGVKMFSGGLSATEMSNMNAAEIARMKARHFVAADKNNDGDSHFVVDFEACAAGFFSSLVPLIYDLTSFAQIKSHTTVILNFLNYLLHHNVCPEYHSQIHATRTICSLAEKELWQIVQAQALLPGDFNAACSEIFGGILQGLYTTGDEEWSQGIEMQRGISPEMARRAFKIGLAARAPRDVFERYQVQSEEKTIGVSSVTDVGLEVTELVPATPYVLNIYNHNLAKGLNPLGILKAKTWYNPSAEDEDLTEEEEKAAATAHREVREYEFWVEDHVLEKCFVGMKFETTVTELSFGVSYFDALFGVYCSFYQVLPNELMYGWREPGPPLPMREKPQDNNGSMGVEVGSGEEADDYEDGEEHMGDEDSNR